MAQGRSDGDNILEVVVMVAMMDRRRWLKRRHVWQVAMEIWDG